MQPYKDHMPIGPAEIVSQDPTKFADRVNELMTSGADEIKIFKPSKEQAKILQNAPYLKDNLKGMDRNQRKEYLKRKRQKLLTTL